MKTLLTLAILTLITFACSNKQTLKEEKLLAAATEQKRKKLFNQVADFPAIKDTTQFINNLIHAFDLEVHQNPVQRENEKITTYKKVKIYGTEKDYIFIEYDWIAGSMAQYPWKYQLLLTTDGKLVKALSGQRFEFVEIFKNENPFLMTVIGTAKGNGGHELYKISADTLHNVYQGYFDYAVRTYDAHQDSRIYEPNELTLKVKDYNNDGYNDISFNGKMVFIQGQTRNGDWFGSETINGRTITYSTENPFKKIPVELVFLYDKQTGHFRAKENYTEKYGLDD